MKDADSDVVLAVDDAAENLNMVANLLGGKIKVKVARSGQKALAIAESDPPDLILLDIMMPEMDGYEVCRTLRASEAYKETPIIFLTAKTEVDDVVKGFAIGANDYVGKPFRPEELLARVRTHLTLRMQQLEIENKNTEMKEMLHIVCHDVANHFMVVSMSLEMIAEEGGHVLLQKCLPRMQAAVRNGTGLTALVRELRKAEDKGLTLKPVPLKAAVDEALLLAQTKAQAKGVELVADVPDVKVLAEGTSLTNSVLGNLLSNAIKFTPKGGRVAVSAAAEGEMIAVTVRDKGVGIPAAMLVHLFDVGKSKSRKGTDGEAGTGFGMPLMHKFVRLYGGRVDVESRDVESHPDDHGTSFTVRLKPA